MPTLRLGVRVPSFAPHASIVQLARTAVSYSADEGSIPSGGSASVYPAGMRRGLSHSEAGRLGWQKTRDALTRHQQAQRQREELRVAGKTCRHCASPIPFGKRCNDYCSRSCSAKANNARRRKPPMLCRVCRVALPSRNWRYCKEHRPNRALIDVELARNDLTRRNVLLRTRGHQCEVCKRRIWRGQPIPLSLDHIDGNAENNGAGNLRLICLNCHGLTPTYAGRNRGRGRAERRARYRSVKS